ncbi:MAG: lysylphosphatidylglycerol synthase domain-containing protein [Deinococcales bacterium]
MKKRTIAILLVSLCFGLAALSYISQGALFEAETYVMRHWSLRLALFSLIAFLLTWLSPALKLMLLCAKRRRLSLPLALSTHMAGTFGAAVTPGNSGGGPATTLALQHLGMSLGQAIGIAMQIFILDLLYFVWSVPLSLGYVFWRDDMKLSGRLNSLSFIALS